MFPRVKEAFVTGDISLSHVSLLVTRLTEANQDVVLNAIKGKNLIESRAILQTIRPNGDIVPIEEATITVTITMTVAEFEKLKRAGEVASHSGHVPSQKDVIVDAVETYLEKKDPLRIAERLEKRRAAARQRPKDNRSDIWCPSAAADPLKETSEILRPNRPSIPAAARHEVWLRDQAQCTYVDQYGNRCGERHMVEIDHIQMWCRGGTHDLSNLRLLCRLHNQSFAALELGENYMFRSS